MGASFPDDPLGMALFGELLDDLDDDEDDDEDGDTGCGLDGEEADDER
jgi:hypothetical protein